MYVNIIQQKCGKMVGKKGEKEKNWWNTQVLSWELCITHKMGEEITGVVDKAVYGRLS